MTRRLLLLLPLLLVGCGPAEPPVYPAGGRVVFRSGAPVTTGVIEFRPASGGPAARGKIEADGRFTLTTGPQAGAVGGVHKVTIVQMASNTAAAAGHGTTGHARAAAVHPRYAASDKSGLTRTVEPAGENHFRIEVDSAADRIGW